MNPKLSVVIPVYNTEPYLRECLDSVINQSFKDIEIIIVNDASLDNSEAIILEYQKSDPRILYIKHEVNKGLFAARETGINKAQGDYILHLDSDDFIALTLCQKLIPLINKNPDCITYSILIWDPTDGMINNLMVNRGLQDFSAPHAFFEDLYQYHINAGALVQKIYKCSILIQSYQEINLQDHLINAEDILVNIWASYYCSSVLHLNFFGYTYRHDDSESATRGVFTLERCLNYLNQLQIVISKLHTFCSLKNLNPNILFPMQKDLLGYYFYLSSEQNIYHYDTLLPKILSIFPPEIVKECFLTHYQNVIISQETYLIPLHSALKLLHLSSEDLHDYPTLQIIYSIQDPLTNNEAILFALQYIQQIRQDNQHSLQQLQQDKWYRFGQLSSKQKIKKIAAIISKKLKLYPFLKKLSRIGKNYA